jgi:hypothetical protein
MHLHNIEANYLKQLHSPAYQFVWSQHLCIYIYHIYTYTYIKTCTHSYMILCCGQHSTTTRNTVQSLNMHFMWKDKQDMCTYLYEHVRDQRNMHKGSYFSFSCRMCYMGRTEEANEWIKTKYEYTRVDTFMAINTYITVFWVTIPCCSWGWTEKQFPTYWITIVHWPTLWNCNMTGDPVPTVWVAQNAC